MSEKDGARHARASACHNSYTISRGFRAAGRDGHAPLICGGTVCELSVRSLCGIPSPAAAIASTGGPLVAYVAALPAAVSARAAAPPAADAPPRAYCYSQSESYYDYLRSRRLVEVVIVIVVAKHRGEWD